MPPTPVRPVDDILWMWSVDPYEAPEESTDFRNGQGEQVAVGSAPF